MKTIKNNRLYRINIILIGVIFLFALNSAGCGKKGDPVYPGVVYPETVLNLTISMKEQVIELNWNVSDEDNRIKRIRILKSETKLDGDFCSDCPRNYSILTELSPKDPVVLRKADGGFCYRDSHIRKGFLYSYKVLVCTSSDVCSGESNRAELKYE